MENQPNADLSPTPNRPFCLGRLGRVFALAALVMLGAMFLFRPG